MKTFAEIQKEMQKEFDARDEARINGHSHKMTTGKYINKNKPSKSEFCKKCHSFCYGDCQS